MQYEKQVEDYICENQEKFIEELKEIYGEDKEFTFVGRQVDLGGLRMDLLYSYVFVERGTPVGDIPHKNFVIVEIKNVPLVPNHFAQLYRYMNLLGEMANSSEAVQSGEEPEIFVDGVFVAPDFTKEASCLAIKSICPGNINFIGFRTELSFAVQEKGSFKWEEGYSVDSRILKLIDNHQGADNEQREK